MGRKIEHASRTEHQRGIANILGQQERPEAAFLRDQPIVASMGNGQRRPRQETRFTDLGADNEPDAGRARRLEHL